MKEFYLFAVFLLLTGVHSECDKAGKVTFTKTWAQQHGVVTFIHQNVTNIPGQASCVKGYVFRGATDVVYCNADGQYQTDNGTCIEDPFVNTRLVQFHGLTYNYTHVPVGSSTQLFPVLYPNTSYIITTNYTVTKTTPTVRVRVGLVGSAKNPVLINVQQSTESVGFELPMKVVGKGNRELAPLNEHTVELCPPTLKTDKKGKEIPIAQHVEVKVAGGGDTDDNPAKGPGIQVHFTYAAHLQLEPGNYELSPKFDDRESLVYRYNWPADSSIDEVIIMIDHFKGKGLQPAGHGPDVCAKLSIRSGRCPIEEMGINELTFTRKAYLTVSKNDKRLKDVKKGFLIVIDVFPDDYRCRSSPSSSESLSRTKSVRVLLQERRTLPPYVFLAVPIATSVLLVISAAFIWFFFINPLGGLVSLAEFVNSDKDESKLQLMVNGEDDASSTLPPFDKQDYIQPPKVMVDFEEVDFNKPADNEGGNDSKDVPSLETSNTSNPADDLLHGVFMGAAGDRSFLSRFKDKVFTNGLVTNITETIGHCAIPLLVFVNTFDSTFIDLQGNLKEHTLDGNLDACYVNSMCAFPANISGYTIPDISRVFSNIPYLISGLCFFLLTYEKAKVMAVINKAGKGVKHDFSIFKALAVITCIIGVASAMYHVCPNQTTSRIDMYFIQILLGYYSLKLYQSRVPDIRGVIYAPAIVICVLSATERILGESEWSWVVISTVHTLFTFWVAVQLLLLGKVTMNPLELFSAGGRARLMEKFRTIRRKPEFRMQMAFFVVAMVATLGIAATGFSGMWTDPSMYNVLALSSDIVIYLIYYIITKMILRKEAMRTYVVVSIVSSLVLWSLSFIFFFSFRSLDSSLSPAESRCLNKACIGGFLDGHDLWHCLSASAIFITNVMILLIDDDLVGTLTEKTYF